MGRRGLTEFTDEVVNRPEVQEMIRRVDFGVDPVAEAAGYNKMTTIIEIKLKDGRLISGRAMWPREIRRIRCPTMKWPRSSSTAPLSQNGRLARRKAMVEMVRRLEDAHSI